MDPRKQIEFRELVLHLLSTIPQQDATTLLDAMEKIEFWIEQYVNSAVSAAVQPYIKINVIPVR